MVKDTFFEKKRLLSLRGKLMDLKEPQIMGILNITPDSFYDGGLYQNKEAIKKRVNEMLTAGAAIIDVGAYSSRPGADPISEEEEIKRLCPALEVIRKEFPDAVISVDTFRSGIAKKAIREFEADMINDISAGMLDPDLFASMAELQVPYLIMHMKGTPQTMQNQTDYKNLTEELIAFFAERVSVLRKLGLHDILIDPGFGFGKSLDQNYQLLAEMDALQILGLPIVAGISRKSMIYKLLDITPQEALNGTSALHMKALEQGASLLRVHDVKEAAEVICLFNKIQKETRRS